MPSVPVPPALLEALERQRKRLREVSPKHRAALLALSHQAQQRLSKRLEELDPDRFTAQQTRQILVQARLTVAELGGDLGKELRSIGEVAAKIGHDGLLDQLAAWGPKFGGLDTRGVGVERAGELLDDALLLHYRTSVGRYGLEKIGRIQSLLAEGALNGETTIQTTRRMSRVLDMEGWRAERIVRTEQSRAAHRRQLLDFEEGLEDGAEAKEWHKELAATFDRRTGQDSIFVNGQKRPLGEAFEDNQGRVYQHPPNRPNDREALLFVPAEVDTRSREDLREELARKLGKGPEAPPPAPEPPPPFNPFAGAGGRKDGILSLDAVPDPADHRRFYRDVADSFEAELAARSKARRGALNALADDLREEASTKPPGGLGAKRLRDLADRLETDTVNPSSLGGALKARYDALPKRVSGSSLFEEVLQSTAGGQSGEKAWRKAVKPSSKGKSARILTKNAREDLGYLYSQDFLEVYGVPQIRPVTVTPLRSQRAYYQSWTQSVHVKADVVPGFTALLRRGTRSTLTHELGHWLEFEAASAGSKRLPDLRKRLQKAKASRDASMARAKDKSVPAEAQDAALDRFDALFAEVRSLEDQILQATQEPSIIHRAVVSWRNHRTQGKPTRKLSEITGWKGYSPLEVAKDGGFWDAYVGKSYPESGASEAFTMGVQEFVDPADMRRLLERDSEHFGLILSILCGKVR